jgi:hypothetical protein
MESISIPGTLKTPSISSDGEKGIIEIKGRSNPENSAQFYKPLIEWVERYSSTPNEKTTINIKLEHFNTSSSKCILDIFKKLEPIRKANREILVNWYYEEDDEEMMEAGETYGTMTIIPFKLIGY